ncbi:MAG: VWA domain-containing protein [Glaciecola sp.]|jgi:Ca-activated chloride channel homolog
MEWLEMLVNQITQHAMQLHFLRPQWLWALIPAAVIYGLIRSVKHRQNQATNMINDVLYNYLTQGGSQTQSTQRLWPLLLGAVLAIVAMAGPTTQKIPKPVYDIAQAKVIVMDMSLSMRATDIAPDRLSRMSYKAIDLINANNGGEIGLIAYAGDAFVISPITTDGTNLNALIPGLRPEIMPEFGSEPELALEKAALMLEQAGYLNGDIIWFTDGVDYDQMPGLTSLLQSMPHRVSILSVGTPDGAPIKLTNGQLLKDSSGAIVIPRLDNASLQTLAGITNGAFTPITADEQDIKIIMQVADTLLADATKLNTLQGDDWYELGPYLLLPVIFIVLLYSRKHWVLLLTIVLLPLCGLTLQQPAFAQAMPQKSSADLPSPPSSELNAVQSIRTPLDFLPPALQNNNQKGLRAFQNGDYATSQSLFTDPEWQAQAQYAQGEYAEALAHFAQTDDALSQYNAGNSLAKLGQYDKALEAYQRANSLDSDFIEAQENQAALELFLQNQPPQDSSQDQSKQDQSDEQNDQEQQDQQSQSQDNQESASDEQESQDQQSQQQQSQDEQSQQNQQQSEDQKEQPSPEESKDEQEQGDDQQKQQDKQQPKEPTQPDEPQESQEVQAQQQEQPLTPEEQEKMQRMQALMNKVPNDPGYLLKRKMELEYQQRKRQQAPRSRTKQW